VTHKFSIGQAVIFVPRPGEFTATSEAVVKRLLPSIGSEFQYHVQIVADGIERRALESQLRGV
jgi:hypothetical protein